MLIIDDMSLTDVDNRIKEIDKLIKEKYGEIKNLTREHDLLLERMQKFYEWLEEHKGREIDVQ